MQRPWSPPTNGKSASSPDFPFLGCLAGRRLSVLLVTRRPRGRLEGLLAACGCQYRHVRESARAVELLRDEPPDAVIVDLQPAQRDALAIGISAPKHQGRVPCLIAIVSDCGEAEAARRAGYVETLAEPLSLVELQGVLLGLAADVADAGARGSEAAKTWSRGTVLFVEEEPEWRELLRKATRRWGFDAWCAWSYAEGLARAREVEPRVVVAALDRLEGGSVKFAEELRRMLPKTSIALVTGSKVSAASVRQRVGGLADIFVKPGEAPELEAWLDEQLAPSASSRNGQ